MSRTWQLLSRPGPPALLVSLPANDVALAQAAVDGGADGLKVHLNVQHRAAGVTFGSLDEEAGALAQIVSLGLPVGIVPGDAERMASPEDLIRLRDLGLDYVDAYTGVMPAWMLDQEALPVMAAVGHDDLPNPVRLQSLARLPQVQMVEASVVAPEGYGKSLSVSDLCDYTGVVSAMGDAKPVIVPTQRQIRPDDLGILASTGIRGLLIGAVVTGQELKQLRAATRRYQDALQLLAPGER